MKELSIEEKAKAYDIALEKIKMLLGTGSSCSREELEYVFPELAESEDERIRKALIGIISNYVDNSNTFKPKMLAWLEKQGEPIDKIVKRATTEKQRVLLTETNGDAYIDWDTRSLQDVKLLLEYGLDYIKKLEKQGEQKPV